MASTPEQPVQLSIPLVELEPVVWRRVQVPSDLTLHCLHSVIQAVFDICPVLPVSNRAQPTLTDRGLGGVSLFARPTP
ncbi:MAG: hypothetical protein BRC57_17010 [Cyanobacteria bacterium QS_8_48_54]|nr:MAG: hypothetical protein BRC57_17010 [Cyanobacteria bacterium QS_8_48_54]